MMLWKENNVIQREKIPKRGDIYYAELETGVGSEQMGKRPVLILQNNIGNKCSPTIVAAIITTNLKRKMPTQILFYNEEILPFKSKICLEQIKTLDKSRLGTYCGNINGEIMEEVEQALRISLGMTKIIEETEDFEEQNYSTVDEKEKEELVKRTTMLDEMEHDWEAMVNNQIIFFENIRQYIINQKYEKEKLEKEIGIVLEFIENTNYNAAQGYNVYKLLRDKRILRKQLVKELIMLEALMSQFDCDDMIRKYQNGWNEMKASLLEMNTMPVVETLAELGV